MKLAIVLAACLAYAVAAPTLDSCKCWNGFEAKQDGDGKVMCHGLRVFALKPCNLPEPPRCVCEKEKPTGILTDKEGTFCSISEKGKVTKKWPCENEQEWTSYKAELEVYEKSL